jgi:outer membrane immunogenic protein
MKKIAIIAILLAASALAGSAQESRQDVSISGVGLIEPYVSANTGVRVHASPGYGMLASYRFMVTPSSALEANYGINLGNTITFSNGYCGASASTFCQQVRTRNHEISFAYVHSFTYRRFNPFVEAGGGALIFSPVMDNRTTTLDAKRQTKAAFLYGAGIAYEISPSFDLRVEYRGLLTKVPDFNDKGVGTYDFTTNKWYNISVPAIGAAYHF